MEIPFMDKNSKGFQEKRVSLKKVHSKEQELDKKRQLI